MATKSARITKRPTPLNVDEYISGFPKEHQLSLQQLRESIKKILPSSEEIISYQVPTIKYKGNYMLAFAGFDQHCGIYTMSKKIITDMKAELSAYYTKGVTIRFEPGKKFPATLLKQILKARIAEHEARKKTVAKKSKK